MEVTINSKLRPFAVESARYKVVYGGRGSAKSWSIARIILLKCMESKLRVLCTREIQDSIKDSVHKLLRDQIDLLELQGFTIQNDVIRHENGSEILFKGLYSNLSKIKSFEGVDLCWIEEAESISSASWEILDPTIRKTGSEIWISFNPRYANDTIYANFVTNTPDNAIVIKMNWQDNKHFPKELEDQKDTMAKNDPDLYLHIWEGELKKNTSELIFNGKWVIDVFENSGEHCYVGADWGYSQDPNTVNKCFIAPHPDYGSNCLYIEHEVNDRPYHEDIRNTSTDLDSLPALWDNMPDIRKYIVKADSARPEIIAHMNKEGFKVWGAKKGAGSIESGVIYIRSFDKVIVHKRCVNTAFEFGNYKYKVDKKSGQVTNIIVDAYNHHIDAIRYALEDLTMNRNSTIGAVTLSFA